MSTNNNLRAILLMIASMAAFAAADSLVKISTHSISPPQVMVLLIGGGLIMFSLIALAQGQPLYDRRAFSRILIIRYVAEVTGMIGMITALAKVPISSVGAITQATPLLVTVGAVIFLKENVGWRRWVSVIVGFIGVLLIVQPGALAFDYSILWALLALVALSARDLTTRLVPKDMPSTSLAAFTMMAALPMTVAWTLLHGDRVLPEQINWLVAFPMITLGGIGYLLLIASLRMAEVSIVMPFRYVRIIFLLVLGVVLFDEKPDALMLLGAFLIIASGVYMMWRENKANKSVE